MTVHNAIDIVASLVMARSAYLLGRASGEERATKSHIDWLNEQLRQAKLAELRGDDRT